MNVKESSRDILNEGFLILQVPYLFLTWTWILQHRTWNLLIFIICHVCKQITKYQVQFVCWLVRWVLVSFSRYPKQRVNSKSIGRYQNLWKTSNYLKLNVRQDVIWKDNLYKIKNEKSLFLIGILASFQSFMCGIRQHLKIIHVSAVLPMDFERYVILIL